MENGAKITRETSKGLLRGEAERGTLKSKEKSKGEKSVAAVVDANVPVRLAESRQLTTATGNSTFDKERDEVGLVYLAILQTGLLHSSYQARDWRSCPRGQALPVQSLWRGKSPVLLCKSPG